MPYAIIPVILIFVSLGAILIIIVNKFPQLSALDTSDLPEVKEAKVKEAIKFQRFNRSFKKIASKIKPLTKISIKFWQRVRSSFRGFVQLLHDKYQALSEAGQRPAPPSAPKVDIGPLLAQAEKLALAGEVAQAEEEYLAVIKVDAKAVEAYRGLGRIYFDQGKYKQAKEIYEFILKLSPDDDRAYNRLGRAALEMGDWELAAKYLEVAVRLNNKRANRFFDLGRAYQALKKPAAALRNFARAVQLESGNPKYLDQLLEMSIIAGDSELGRETYDRLRLANPDNKKLAEFKQRIDEIAS